MFKVHLSDVDAAATAVKTCVTDTKKSFDAAHKHNKTIIESGDGAWTAAADSAFISLETSLNALHSGLDQLSTNLNKAQSQLKDDVASKRDTMMNAIDASVSDADTVMCDPNSNVGANVSSASQTAAALRQSATSARNTAAGLDGSGGERQMIIDALDALGTAYDSARQKLDSLDTGWKAFSAAVSTFESTYGGLFSQELIDEGMMNKARIATSQMLLDAYKPSASGSLDGDIEFNVKKAMAEGKIYIDENGNLVADGSADAEYLLVQMNGTAEGEVNLFGLKMHGKATGEAKVGAEAHASATLDRNGLSAEASVQAGAEASGKAEGNIGNLGTAELEGKTFAGGRANATATVNKDGVDANVDAFAGAEAKADGSVSFFGLTLSGEASASAGAGAKAGVNIGKGEDGKWHFGAKASATLGVGGGLGFDISVDPDWWTKSATSFVSTLVN